MSEAEWLRDRWMSVNPDFRRQAMANAVGTFLGGVALAVLLGLAALSARYVATWVLLVAAAVAALVWIIAIGGNPRNNVTAAIALFSLSISGAVIVLSVVAAVARLALLQ